jgi:hypothetical protein
LPSWFSLSSEAEADAGTDTDLDHQDVPDQSAGTSDAESVDWWSLLSPDQHAELTAPRKPKAPCFFCGGRSRHSQQCIDQRDEWLVMPYGKHNDVPVRDVPLSYLRWFSGREPGWDGTLHVMRNVSPDVRERIEQALG